MFAFPALTRCTIHCLARSLCPVAAEIEGCSIGQSCSSSNEVRVVKGMERDRFTVGKATIAIRFPVLLISNDREVMQVCNSAAVRLKGGPSDSEDRSLALVCVIGTTATGLELRHFVSRTSHVFFSLLIHQSPLIQDAC